MIKCDCRAAIGSENEDGSKKFVIRPYTPTSPKDAKGYFDLVVKVYEQGKMSKHFGELKAGAFLLLHSVTELMPAATFLLHHQCSNTLHWLIASPLMAVTWQELKMSATACVCVAYSPHLLAQKELLCCSASKTG